MQAKLAIIISVLGCFCTIPKSFLKAAARTLCSKFQQKVHFLMTFLCAFLGPKTWAKAFTSW